MFTMMAHRNRDANELAHKALSSTKGQFEVIEILKTISWLQAVRLDEWENWGRESSQVWNQITKRLEDCESTPSLPRMPAPPEGHLDLRKYWRNIEEIVDRDKDY